MIIAANVKITNAKKTDVPPKGIETGICNNFLFSLFKSAKVGIGAKSKVRL